MPTDTKARLVARLFIGKTHRKSVEEIFHHYFEETTVNTTDIARVCHEINRAYCIAIGDMSQPTWSDAPDWQKHSAVNGVMAHVKNPKMTPEESHQLWLNEKEAAGWTYAQEKDAVLKTHPCILPYEQLPLEQRVKDHLFSATVRALSPTLPA